MKQKLLLFMLLLTSLATYAYEFESNGIYYNITSADDKTVEVTSGDTEYTGDVVIPETVTYSDTEYTVTSIGNYAFYDCGSLISIELPSSLTEIGNYAFDRCSSLISIELPSSLTSIGGSAFYLCTSLQEITVSEANENYTSVDGVLYNKNLSTLICCPASKSGVFTVPASVTTIGDYAFCDCISLTSIELPASVTWIREYAFAYCTSLTSIELPSSVTSIGGSAFYYCPSLASIELPQSVTTIGNYAFGCCSSLASIELPSSLTTIGEGAFSNCFNLERVKLPSSLTTIGEFAFSRCYSLTSIVLPASLTTIGNYAFCNCESLKTVTSLNPEPPVLGETNVFYDCPIEAVYVPDEAVDAYKVADGWKKFNIVGIDTSGVEDAIIGGDVFGGEAVESATVYTLQGVRVKGVRTMDDVKSLTPGLYIVNGKKVFVK